MFLFLSKLLPLLIYPVGLAIVLTIVTGVLILRKRSRLGLIPLALAFLILWVSSSEGFNRWIVTSLEWQNRPSVIPTADAIVVLGGATSSQMSPRPWVEVGDEGDRVLYAAKLYREQKAPRIVLTGGRIAWRDGGTAEAIDMATLLETMGVPRSALLFEEKALNTHENAVNVKPILEAQRVQKFLLVTSALHMPRSLMIFRKLGMDPIPAPTDFRMVEVGSSQDSVEAFLLSLLPDADQLRLTTRALKEYIGILVYRLQGWA
ncbi:MAG: YdcF family protein [Synechococcales bacterium]|nr:YdcF family protein [Synechococcales bacterium]